MSIRSVGSLLPARLLFVLIAATVVTVPPSALDARGAEIGATITSPVTDGNVGRESRVLLDGDDNPTLRYIDPESQRLIDLNCNDPFCLGDDESVGVAAGPLNPVQRDASGFLVFGLWTDGSLEVVHCRNALCSDASRTFPDPDDQVTGRFGISLVLDVNGFPVISYYGIAEADLRIMHCNDPDCAGMDETISAPVPDGVTGQHSEIVLDLVGNPVVAYYDTTRGRLAVLHCDDPDCAGAETAVYPDPARVTGRFGKSLALDSGGNPVVSYYDITNGDLKLLRCGTPDCSGSVRVIPPGNYPPSAYPPNALPPVPTSPITDTPDPTLPATGRSPVSALAPILLVIAGVLLVGASRNRPVGR